MSRRARLDQVEPPVVYPGALAVQILLSERMWEETPRVAGGNYAFAASGCTRLRRPTSSSGGA